MARALLYNGAHAVAGGGLAALALSRLLASGFSVASWLLFVGGVGMAVAGGYYAAVGEFAGAEPSPVHYWSVVCCGLLAVRRLENYRRSRDSSRLPLPYTSVSERVLSASRRSTSRSNSACESLPAA